MVKVFFLKNAVRIFGQPAHYHCTAPEFVRLPDGDESTSKTLACTRITVRQGAALGGLTDGELLDCFLDSRDSVGHEAFRLLVERHGPMVRSVCRGLVFDQHEADDAFQATFLVLVKKAGSINSAAIRSDRGCTGWPAALPGGGARHSFDRSRREVAVNVDIPCDDRPDDETSALGEIIHDEIARLPDSFRGPIVLCCLEGLSYDLAVRQLGLKEPALRGRLHRARKQLEARLNKRGITTGIFASASEKVRLNLSPLPSSLVESTIQFSIRWSSVTGLLPAAVIPAAISGLAEGVARTMLLQTFKVSGVVVLVAAGRWVRSSWPSRTRPARAWAARARQRSRLRKP